MTDMAPDDRHAVCAAVLPSDSHNILLRASLSSGYPLLFLSFSFLPAFCHIFAGYAYRGERVLCKGSLITSRSHVLSLFSHILTIFHGEQVYYLDIVSYFSHFCSYPPPSVIFSRGMHTTANVSFFRGGLTSSRSLVLSLFSHMFTALYCEQIYHLNIFPWYSYFVYPPTVIFPQGMYTHHGVF